MISMHVSEPQHSNILLLHLLPGFPVLTSNFCQRVLAKNNIKILSKNMTTDERKIYDFISANNWRIIKVSSNDTNII